MSEQTLTISEENKQKAEELKNKANQFFQEGRFLEALKFYEDAISFNPLNSIYFANKAFSEIKLEQYGAAISDATRAIELDKTYAKAYYRRGSAYLALGKYKLAKADYGRVKQLYPNNKEAKEKYDECEKISRRLAFENAISIEEVSASTVASKELETLEVDSSYDGLHFNRQTLNEEFVKKLIEEFKKQKKIHTKYVYTILLAVREIFLKSPTLLEIDVPEGHIFNVCGDTHGQFYDVANIFEINGLPSPTNPYLFNGDFVDRGSFSVEVILTFFVLKVLYPNHFHLLRGNHETKTMNQMYGFQGEVEAKYNKKVFDLFTEVFCLIPLCAVINKKVFVTHGGLFSQNGVKLEDLKKVDRNRQPPEEGLMCELLWSDPQPFPGRAPNKRGVGIAFGPDVTHNFLKDNNLELVVRSHEVKEQGYLVEADGKLITIFSAPNYCDSVGNLGALIKFSSEMKPSFVQFKAVPHPPVKPMAYSGMSGLF